MQQNSHQSRIIELPQSPNRSQRLSMDSTGSNRMRRAGQSIMGSVPKVANKQPISIPTGFTNRPFAQQMNQNQHQMGFDQFEEEFCFGSPQKRQPSSFGYEDSLTQDGTPDKDILMSKVNGNNSHFTSLSDEHSTFSDHISQTGPSDFHRDVFDDSPNTSYELIQNVHIGQKQTSKTAKKQKVQKSDEPIILEQSQFSSLFSNQMILSQKPQSKQTQQKIANFKQTAVFRLLRDLNSNFDDLELRDDEEIKFDFENEKGNETCRTILKLIAKVYKEYGLKKNERSYREKFTKAYKVLYSQNGGANELCYLQEILDSAQENFPHLWVNGEKYVFSEDVTKAGNQIFRSFLDLRDKVSEFIDKKIFNIDPTYVENEKELMQCLLDFDASWTEYEQFYVYELMVIETDARRFVIEAIQIEQQMQDIEIKLSNKGKDVMSNKAYNEKREELVVQMSQINTVCNMNGKGRDDLTDIQILQAAEEIPHILKQGQAQSVQALADKIKQSFNCFRVLIRKYSENIDALDPQLKNNGELVELIEIYESSWTLGKEQLQDSATRDQLINFCINISALGNKYPVFKEQVECSEAEIFLSIPTLMVLKSIQNDKDSISHDSLCQRFAENLDLASLKSQFNNLPGDKKSICEQLEQFIIQDEAKCIQSPNLLEFGQRVKSVGMELSRANPTAFNGFITAALGE